MADVPELDPAAVAAAVRALLRKETDRVDHPVFIPEDRAGWHPVPDPGPDSPGAPYYDPESWRWFELVDVGLVDELVLVTFRWTDPSTPELRYSFLGHADGLASADAVATVLRGQLRRLLEPGWRDRVEKRWLSRTKVLVRRPPSEQPDLPELAEYRIRRDRRIDADRERAWRTARGAPPE